jgi:hypothetical protein
MTEDDTRKRDVVKELIQSENKGIADFAKHLVTVSFSAIGFVLALKEKWLGTNAPLQQKVLLGLAIVLFMAAALLATMAAGIYQHRVSLSDYADVDTELHRVARLRYRLTRVGFAVLVLATILLATIVISG